MYEKDTDIDRIRLSKKGHMDAHVIFVVLGKSCSTGSKQQVVIDISTHAMYITIQTCILPPKFR